MRLAEILETMDIPEQRKTDMRWLIRNIGIRNREHKDYEEAVSLIRESLRKGSRNNA